jgi:hypothetical protein
VKKVFFIALVLFGAVSGWWLAQGNLELFQILGVVPRGQEEVPKRRPIDDNALILGLEIWQVKDAFGPPEERIVEAGTQGFREERWRYGDKWLYFTNGVLTSLQEMQ